jgi:hypothetical protein
MLSGALIARLHADDVTGGLIKWLNRNKEHLGAKDRGTGERRAEPGTGKPQTQEGLWCWLPSIELNPVVVRCVWRHAAYPAEWSTGRHQLLLDDFALAAPPWSVEQQQACFVVRDHNGWALPMCVSRMSRR